MADKAAKGRSPAGDKNGSRKHPERLKRGDEHPSRKHPECLSRGAAHWLRKYPEKIKRGRQVGTAKLTEDAVRSIRQRYKPRVITHQILAAEYGVERSIIGLIVNRKSWKHVA